MNPVIIDYTNWRGVRSLRKITPHFIGFCRNEWHPEPQWLLTAYDYPTDSVRQFAMADIHSWADVEAGDAE